MLVVTRPITRLSYREAHPTAGGRLAGRLALPFHMARSPYRRWRSRDLNLTLPRWTCSLGFLAYVDHFFARINRPLTGC
jgi:hypothetical protein